MDKFLFVGKPLIKLIKKTVIKKYYSCTRPGVSLKHDLEDIIAGMFGILKAGTQINLYSYKGISGNTIMYHFYKWSADGIFKKVWKEIYNSYQKKFKYYSNLKKCSIDCTLIKSMNGHDSVGKNPTDRGRNGTKISLLVDMLGVPIGYVIDAANVDDRTLLDKTLKNRITPLREAQISLMFLAKKKTRSELYADKGYSYSSCKNDAKEQNFTLLCKNKSNAVNILFPENIKIEAIRYVVEASNRWIKGFKKLILRYEKKYPTMPKHL